MKRQFNRFNNEQQSVYRRFSGYINPVDDCGSLSIIEAETILSYGYYTQKIFNDFLAAKLLKKEMDKKLRLEKKLKQEKYKNKKKFNGKNKKQIPTNNII